MAGDKWARALHDRDARVRKKAAFTLGNIGPTHPAVLPALIGALKDDDPEVRTTAILALVKFGRDATEAVPTLTEVQRGDTDDRVRAYAGKALAKIQGK
jgi:HEAT repeat protein